jgi:hypothetical protein
MYMLDGFTAVPSEIFSSKDDDCSGSGLSDLEHAVRSAPDTKLARSQKLIFFILEYFEKIDSVVKKEKY